MKKSVRVLSGVILLIIALNAFGGGVYGMTGAKEVPLEWLEGSPFKNYFFPSLFLFAVVGGFCLVTAIQLFRNVRRAGLLSFICGSLLVVWICMQVLVIGFVSWLQPAVLIAGIFVATVSVMAKKRP